MSALEHKSERVLLKYIWYVLNAKLAQHIGNHSCSSTAVCTNERFHSWKIYMHTFICIHSSSYTNDGYIIWKRKKVKTHFYRISTEEKRTKRQDKSISPRILSIQKWWKQNKTKISHTKNSRVRSERNANNTRTYTNITTNSTFIRADGARAKLESTWNIKLEIGILADHILFDNLNLYLCIYFSCVFLVYFLCFNFFHLCFNDFKYIFDITTWHFLFHSRLDCFLSLSRLIFAVLSLFLAFKSVFFLIWIKLKRVWADVTER